MMPVAPSPDPDDLLAQLAAEGQEAAPPVDEVAASTLAMRRRVIGQAATGWVSTRDGVQHLRYTHEDCIDKVLISPGISQNDLAQLYGVTPAWMSIVMNCDAFKARLAERKQELLDPVLSTSLNERFGALAARSAEVLLEKLAQPVEKISDRLALEAASLGAKVMGLGEAPPSGPANSADHLAAIAHRLIDLNSPARPATIDVETRKLEG